MGLRGLQEKLVTMKKERGRESGVGGTVQAAQPKDRGLPSESADSRAAATPVLLTWFVEFIAHRRPHIIRMPFGSFVARQLYGTIQR